MPCADATLKCSTWIILWTSLDVLPCPISDPGEGPSVTTWSVHSFRVGGLANGLFPRAPVLDLQRDEDLDTSYEALIELSGLLGEVRPRGLSEQAIAALPSGTYGEWATPGETEERCPICLDDVRILAL